MFSRIFKVTLVVAFIATCFLAGPAQALPSADPMTRATAVGAIDQPVSALMDGGR